MKNITKIIESSQEILDKCSYWFDTNKNILKRYSQGMWLPITSTSSGSSFSLSAQAPLSLEELSEQEKELSLKYDKSSFKVNDDGELTIINKTSKTRVQTTYQDVKWCPRGKINLDTDINIPCIIPTRDRCPMVRMSNHYLRNKYRITTQLHATERVIYNLHDLVEDARQEILKNLTIEVSTDDTAFPQQSVYLKYYNITPVITWRIHCDKSIICNRRVSNPLFYHGYCYNDPKYGSTGKYKNNGIILTTQDPVILSIDTKNLNIKITPYITLINPFSYYGGQVNITECTNEDGKITIKLKINKIKPLSKFYEPSRQVCVDYNNLGVQCNGSYKSSKHVLYARNTSNTYDVLRRLTYKPIDFNQYNRNYRDWYDKKREVQNNIGILKTNFRRMLYVNLKYLGQAAYKAFYGSKSIYGSQGHTLYVQEIDPLYKKTRTQSEYTEKYKLAQMDFSDIQQSTDALEKVQKYAVLKYIGTF